MQFTWSVLDAGRDLNGADKSLPSERQQICSRDQLSDRHFGRDLIHVLTCSAASACIGYSQSHQIYLCEQRQMDHWFADCFGPAWNFISLE